MMNANAIPTAFFGLQDLFNSLSNMGSNNKNETECLKREYTYSPKAEFYEVENGFTLEVELPGVKKEALDIQVEKNILTVKASRTRRDNTVNYERSFRLADEIDADNIQVSLADGILTFNLVKKQQAAARKLNVM